MMNQWINPLLCCAATGVATWIMWTTIKDVARRNIVDATRWRLIERLRQGGVSTSIMFHQSNDDPVTNDDQEAITINADWTEWEDRMYRAASVDICLSQAINDMERADNGR
jgi:hypothetical protein